MIDWNLNGIVDWLKKKEEIDSKKSVSFCFTYLLKSYQQFIKDSLLFCEHNFEIAPLLN